jgi:hypothetical protein
MNGREGKPTMAFSTGFVDGVFGVWVFICVGHFGDVLVGGSGARDGSSAELLGGELIFCQGGEGSSPAYV